jgi:hypothetical protein
MQLLVAAAFTTESTMESTVTPVEHGDAVNGVAL